MKRILFQSDDYGITQAVSEGILRGIREGIIRNTGLFVNMDCSAWAAEKIKDVDVCLGVDINYVAGKPVSDPAQVPHLVKEDGRFYSSGEQNRRNQLVRREGLMSIYEEDPYPYEEILLETENQVKRFQELTGKMPEYLHPHSLITPNTDRAAREVAAKYGIYHTMDMLAGKVCRELPGAIMNQKGLGLEAQLQPPVEQNLLEHALPSMQDNETAYYIFHCGYVDADLFRVSSLTVRRAIDLDAALSSRVKDYIRKHQIELITYREL